MSLEQVERWYRLGVLSRVKRDGFYVAWFESAARFGHRPLAPALVTGEVEAFAALVRSAASNSHFTG
jgi:hypothetical protein